jgi:hypothetical protein
MAYEGEPLRYRPPLKRRRAPNRISYYISKPSAEKYEDEIVVF